MCFIIIIVFHSLTYYHYYYYYYFIIIIITLTNYFFFSQGGVGSPFLRGDTSINVVSFSLDMSSWLAVITVCRYWKINYKNAIWNVYISLESAQLLSLFRSFRVKRLINAGILTLIALKRRTFYNLSIWLQYYVLMCESRQKISKNRGFG